jgi:hypothetical protein
LEQWHYLYPFIWYSNIIFKGSRAEKSSLIGPELSVLTNENCDHREKKKDWWIVKEIRGNWRTKSDYKYHKKVKPKRTKGSHYSNPWSDPN